MRVQSVDFSPYFSSRASIIYFHILSFYVFFSTPWAAFTLDTCVCVCVCAVPGSCCVCVLSLSLVSTQNSRCPYLKWPEPHQEIKSPAPPASLLPRTAGWALQEAVHGGGELARLTWTTPGKPQLQLVAAQRKKKPHGPSQLVDFCQQDAVLSVLCDDFLGRFHHINQSDGNQ